MQRFSHPLQQHVRRQVLDPFITRHENIRPGQDGGGHMDGIWRALCWCFSSQFGGKKKHFATYRQRLNKRTQQALASSWSSSRIGAHQHFGAGQVSGDQAGLCSSALLEPLTQERTLRCVALGHVNQPMKS